jgi:hypothetical protein
MAVERRSPLPVARYWVDVSPAAAPAFNAWVAASAGAVAVRTTSTYDDGWTWYLFDVTSPVPWNGPGFPTIATPDVKTPADVITSPPVVAPTLNETITSIGRNAALALFALAALAILLREK